MEILPFSLEAVVLLPDHLHAIWTLPAGDADYSRRWAGIKRGFTTQWLGAAGGEATRSQSRERHRRRGVWQRRFWEHLIRDPADFEQHLHYIHYNPVKHGYVRCPHGWRWSTFEKWITRGVYDRDWQCSCNDQRPTPPDFRALDATAME